VDHERSPETTGSAAIDPGDFPQSFGPQGDVQSVFNMACCVRELE
jgi:hypothetical protein